MNRPTSYPSTSREDSGDAIERLRKLSTSPFPPEAPRRSLLVDAAMWLTSRSTVEYQTPHLYGGSAEEKLRFEYEGAEDFWRAFEGDAGPETLRGRQVLDVGCGWGGKDVHYAKSASPARLVGFDLPGLMDPEVPARAAREQGLDNCEFTTGRAEQIPFGDAEFDAVIMDDVLEHVAEPDRVLAECARVLHPGGLLLARFPSIRMLSAHHLDRAIAFPGLHYLLPLRVWAAGLNDRRLRHAAPAYEPFDAVGATPYHRAVTRNLNGLDLRGFRELVTRSSFRVHKLDLVAPDAPVTGWKGLVFRMLSRRARTREMVTTSIAFIGERE